MTCPSRFIGKRIDLSLSFTNASFFKENTVDHWHLDDFITWKRHDNKGFNDCFPLLSEYEYALNNLKQVRQLDPVLISYVTELKINNKYTKKAFKTWWENRRSGTPSSNTTIINNNNSRNTNILSASNVTVNSTECVPPPPPQQQPQQGQAPPSPAPTQQQGHISKDISEPRMSERKGKRRQDDIDDDKDDASNDDNTSDDDYDIFLNKNNILRLQKKNKTYDATTPQVYLISPNKPRLQIDDFNKLKSNFDIILSEDQSSSSSSSTPYSQHIYKKSREEQARNQSLNDAPGTMEFLMAALEQPLDNICQYVWSNGRTDNKDESMNNEMIRHILTDFYINCNITNDNSSTPTTTANERTPFAEHLIPIFKVFAGITHLMKFAWCEKGLASNRLLSLCLPNKLPLRSLLDGIGMSVKDGAERLLIESSGDNIEHSEEDTIKQICNTSSCLKMDMKKYQFASFDTFRRRQVFGLQFINDKMTLTTTSIIDKERYAFIETRSARIPTSYKDRWNWIKVFELLLKLKADLLEQEKVTDLLERECVGVTNVGPTVQGAMK